MTSTQPAQAAAHLAAPTPSNMSISQFDSGLGGVNQAQNMLFRDVVWWCLGIAALVILSIRFQDAAWAQLRHVSAMSRPAAAQAYWRTAQWSRTPWIKKNLTYAPIWRKRHNREIRLSSALNMGTLPTRLQAVLLVAYIASNLVYTFFLDYKQPNHWALLAELRGRSGVLATVNLVPLILLAARNNPLISMLRISFDTYNLLHRWIGRTVAAQSIIHMAAWLAVQVKDGGWASARSRILHDRFITSGMVGTLAFVVLVGIAMSPLRHAFYETFLVSHIVLAVVILICIWVHCATASIPGGLPQLPWVIAVILLWMAERLARVGLNAYRSWSRHGWPDAVVQPMQGECCRVTIHLPRYADVRPGTHAYLRFYDINPLECHPFSIAWVEHKPIAGHGDADILLPLNNRQAGRLNEKAPTGRLTGFNATKQSHLLRTSVSFVIGAQTGFTRKLYDRARKTGQPSTTFNALFEGPYAGHHSLDSYGHVVLVAGATGITHQLSYLQHLLDGYAEGTVATRRITLVWVVRDYEALEWVRPWMDEIMRLPGRPEVLQMRLFVTRPKQALNQNGFAGSRSIQIFPGRPNIPVLLKKEVSEQAGAMAVTVCGSGALADDVRTAVREVLDEGTVVDFIEESFTW